MPTHRLASAALQSLSVDAELSPLVHRSFSLINERRTLDSPRHESQSINSNRGASIVSALQEPIRTEATVLKTEYKATTNRMLRVAVNGFMESLGVVLDIMGELDIDVLA